MINFKKCFFCAPSLSSFKQKEILSIFTKQKLSLDFSYNINSFINNKYNLEFKKNSQVQKYSKKYKLNYKNLVFGYTYSQILEICQKELVN